MRHIAVGHIAKISRHFRRGFATDKKINSQGSDFRQELEDITGQLSERAWRNLGDVKTRKFCDHVMSHNQILLLRIVKTAGKNWMPVARDSRRRSTFLSK